MLRLGDRLAQPTGHLRVRYINEFYPLFFMKKEGESRNLKKKWTPEIARIHAHICGDGCVYIRKQKYSGRKLERHPRKNIIENVWTIEYTNTCHELIDDFSKIFNKSFDRKSIFSEKTKSLRIASAKWIIEYLQVVGKDSYNWNIPPQIMEAKPDILCSWLQAFFDDESTVITEKKMIRIKSMNNKGLEQTKELLKRVGIYSRITGPNCDRSYYLNIYREGVGLYSSLINFRHPEKKEKLRIIIIIIMALP